MYQNSIFKTSNVKVFETTHIVLSALELITYAHLVSAFNRLLPDHFIGTSFPHMLTCLWSPHLDPCLSCPRARAPSFSIPAILALVRVARRSGNLLAPGDPFILNFQLFVLMLCAHFILSPCFRILPRPCSLYPANSHFVSAYAQLSLAMLTLSQPSHTLSTSILLPSLPMLTLSRSLLFSGR